MKFPGQVLAGIKRFKTPLSRTKTTLQSKA